jgi:hypothetical protein
MSTTDIDAIRVLLRQDLERIAAADAEIVELHQAIRDAQQREEDARLDPQHEFEGWGELSGELPIVQDEATRSRQAFAARTELLAHVDLGDTTVEELIAEAARPVEPAPIVAGGPGRAPNSATAQNLTATGAGTGVRKV